MLAAKSFQAGLTGAGDGGRRFAELGRYCTIARPVGVAGTRPLTLMAAQ